MNDARTRPDPDIPVLALLEPGAATVDRDAAIVLSIAISLRRIADAVCEPVGANGEPDGGQHA